jgi:hypothetical protein
MNQQNIDKIKEVFGSIQNRNIIKENVDMVKAKNSDMKTRIDVIFHDLNKMCGELNVSDLARFQSIQVLEGEKDYSGNSTIYYLTANHRGWGYIKEKTPGATHHYGTTQSNLMSFMDFLKNILFDDAKWQVLKTEAATRKRFLTYLLTLESVKNELLVLNDFKKELDNYHNKISIIPIHNPFYVSKEGEYHTAKNVGVVWYADRLEFNIKNNEEEEDSNQEYHDRNKTGWENNLSTSSMLLCATYHEELERFFDIECDNVLCEAEQTEYLLKKIENAFSLYYLTKSLATGGE